MVSHTRYITRHLQLSLEHALYLAMYCTQELYVRHPCWVLVLYQTVIEQSLSRIASLEDAH